MADFPTCFLLNSDVRILITSILQLAMAVLAGLFGGTYASLSGGSKKSVQTPPINASTPDEADFIQYAYPGYPATN